MFKLDIIEFYKSCIFIDKFLKAMYAKYFNKKPNLFTCLNNKGHPVG
jgi:hypothetical protein